MVWVVSMMDAITWAALNNAWYFVFFVIAIALLFTRYRKKQKAIYLLVGSNNDLLKNVSLLKQCGKLTLFATGVLFLCIALLRPQWDKSEETIVQEGRDLYIALDISRSMLATDIKPNRLTRAKDKIKQLVQHLSCERVGLILFSGSAFVQCPLTSDYGAFYLYLDSVDAELISSGTTALSEAIKQALDSFACVPDRKNKLLALFTDGEDFSRNLSDIKQEAVDACLSIFTVGVGTPEGAPIPVLDHHGVMIGHQKDARGNVVISRLNEDVLHNLSHDAGGKYICLKDDDGDIATLVKLVESFEKEQLGERKHARYEDQYHYFLLVSFICFLLEWLL